LVLGDSLLKQKEAELAEQKETLQGLYVEGQFSKWVFYLVKIECMLMDIIIICPAHKGEKLSVEQGKDRKKIKEMKTKEVKLEKDKTEVAEKLEQATKKIDALQLDLKAAERYKGIAVFSPVIFSLFFLSKTKMFWLTRIGN